MGQEMKIEIGKVLTGSSRTHYKVEKKLGEGVTSEVYQARDLKTNRSVALKILRPDVSQMIVDNFWQETQILGELVHAERLTGSMSHVPRLLDRQPKTAIRFLVLELVTGEPLNRLLAKQIFLEEQLALNVAEQVLQVLHLLHQRVRRTYTDLQLRNIYLQSSAEGTLVKVLDWNHVSDKWPDDQPLPAEFGAKDLMRFAAYFYRMLTGKGTYERGESERTLEKRAGKRWQALSLGTRQIIQRALHPNPTRRFNSAAAFRQAVQQQQSWWRQDWLDLLGQVKELSPSSVSQLQPEQITAEDEWRAERAKAALEMAKRLGAPDQHVNYYHKLLDLDEHEISLAWRAGEQYYKAEQYREAAAKWREEAEAKGRLELWHQVMLAEVGGELRADTFAAIRDSLEKAVQALQEKDGQWADELLSEWPELSSASLDILRQEARAYKNVWQAQQDERKGETTDLENAAQAYRDAIEALDSISYGLLIYEEQKQEWPDLHQRAEELDALAKDYGRTDDTLVELKQLLRNAPEQGRQELKRQLQHNPTNQRLVALCLEEGERQLRANNPQRAEAVLAIGVWFAQVEEYKQKVEQSWQKALVQIPVERDYQEELTQLQRTHKSEIASKRKANQEEVTRLQREHESLVASKRKANQEEITRLQREHESLVASTRKANQEEITRLQREHESLVVSTRKANQEEITRLQREHESLVVSTRKANQEELADLQSKHESLVASKRKEYEKAEAVAQQELEQKLATLKPKEEKALTRVRELYEQKRETLESQHEELKAHMEEKHKKELNELQEKIDKEKREQEEFLAQLEKESEAELLPELIELLNQKRWTDFLALIPKTSDKLLLKLRSDWASNINPLKKHFNEVNWSYQVPVAQTLLEVLAVLDPTEAVECKDQYDRMTGVLRRQKDKWPEKIKRLIEFRRLLADSSAAYDEIIDDIDRLMPLAESDYPELKKWLERTRQRLEKARDESSRTSLSSRNIPDKPKIEFMSLESGQYYPSRPAQQTRHPKQTTYEEVSLQRQEEKLAYHINEAFSQIHVFTYKSIDNSVLHFEQALILIGQISDRTDRKKVRAANQLVRYLNQVLEDRILAYIKKKHAKRPIGVMKNQDFIEWLSESTVLELMCRARENYKTANDAWVNGQRKSAAKWSKAALEQAELVQVIINLWWGELTEPNNKLPIKAIKDLKRDVKKFRNRHGLQRYE